MSDCHTRKAKEVVARCSQIAAFTETPGCITRTFLCSAMRDCHREMGQWLEKAGARVRIDAVGNLRGVYPGAEERSPRLVIGSHLDTVPNAGAYDGVLGVVLAVALVELLGRKRLPFAIEIVGFSEEEGVRFQTPFIGSRALVGRVDDELLAREDSNGVPVKSAIENFGLRVNEIRQAVLDPDVVGYVEFHIEQGPVLEQLGRPLGVIEAIAGQTRMALTFGGRANHAGTTPMNARRDALAGAAEWICEVEEKALKNAGLTATVGTIEVKPGATNVISSEARVTFDARHCNDRLRIAAVEELRDKAEEIARRRQLVLRHELRLDQPAVGMDATMTRQAEEAIRSAGCEPHRMVSGAGHDAMILAEKAPATMIFLRTPGGISHSPEETVEVGDVAKALEAGSQLLDLIASAPSGQRRTERA